MCLTKLTHTEEQPEAKGIGYKVIYKNITRDEYCSVFNNPQVPHKPNEESKAICEPIGYQTKYISGFHIFSNKKAAIEYSRELQEVKNHCLAVVKVK